MNVLKVLGDPDLAFASTTAEGFFGAVETATILVGAVLGFGKAGLGFE